MKWDKGPNNNMDDYPKKRKRNEKLIRQNRAKVKMSLEGSFVASFSKAHGQSLVGCIQSYCRLLVG